MAVLLAHVPRTSIWLGGAFLLLIVAVAAGLHRPLDRALTVLLWQEMPCWGRILGERISVAFAAELSLLYALGLGFVCLRARRPFAAGWIMFLLFAGVGIEIVFKYYFTHPAPSAFLETLSRPPCGPPGPAYPLTTVPTPSTLPSGYSIRATYFCLLAAAMVGGRWPELRLLAWPLLAAIGIAAAATRVTVGWHWPTDVAAGVLLGACAAVLVTAQADGFRWLRAGGAPSSSARGRGRGSSRSGSRGVGASGGRGSGSRSAARPPRR